MISRSPFRISLISFKSSAGSLYEMVEDFTISMEKAKEVRLELMNERKKFVIKQDDYFNDTIFSLCEQ